MKMQLPPRVEFRMWADGRTGTFRYRPKGKNWINLGTEYEEAMQRYRTVSGPGEVYEIVGPALVRETWARHAKGAKQRRIEFTITEAHVADAVERQAHRCAVTRLPFSTGKPHGLRVRPWLPSIDRKDSARGYVPGNIRVVCAFVNVAMNGFGEKLFRLVLEPLVAEAVEERLRELKNSQGGNQAREFGGNSCLNDHARLPEEALQINELDGVADRTRTDDDQNHNLRPQVSIHAGSEADEGNACD